MSQRICFVLALLIFPVAAAADTWPVWRGPAGTNHANPKSKAPIQWDLKTGQNIAWKTPLPGRGHSTPVVTADSIFLTTAEQKKQSQSLLKFDRRTGELVKSQTIHQGGLPAKIHPSNSHASATAAYDGQHLFVVFYTHDSVMLTKLDTDLNQAWQKKVCDFTPSLYQFGYGPSPLIEDQLVIVSAEYDGSDSGLYAFDRSTGKQAWKTPRPQNISFATPIIANTGGKRQILMAGSRQFASYDPKTGRMLWKLDDTTLAICNTAVWDEQHVLASGGYPESGTWCVAADGSRTVWNNTIKCYEQSLLVVGDYVYGIADTGVGYCWRISDGEQMWKKRLFSGKISASPLLADGRIYVATESGEVFVLAADSDRFQLIAEIQTGNSIFATPVVVDDQLLIRSGVKENGRRQEYLIAVNAGS